MPDITCKFIPATRSKTDALCAAGAKWQDSPAQLAKHCNVIITMVGYPEDVNNIYMGSQGIFKTASPGTITLDMTTSRPDLAVTLYKEGQKKTNTMPGRTRDRRGYRGQERNFVHNGAGEIYPTLQRHCPSWNVWEKTSITRALREAASIPKW